MLSETTAYRYLFRYLSRYEIISSDLKEKIEDCTQFNTLPKKTILLETNTQCKVLYFIVKGICRQYFVKNNQEYVTNIAHGGCFFTSYYSFLSKEKSFEYIETLQETSIICISERKLTELLEKYPKLDAIFKQMMRDYIIEKEYLIYKTRGEKANEKVTFILSQPKIRYVMNKISNAQVASFAQVTPETFSRIRKNISKKQRL